MRTHGILFFSFLMFIFCSCNKGENRPPNVLIILADDMGYSDLSCMGSEIPTPNIDRIAEEGALFTNFYNAARCCPTRASLLTGLYPHQAGMGDMTEGRIRKDGTYLEAYQGYLHDQSVTIAEILQANGYQTFISGKWHVGDASEHWPLQRGFDRSFSLISGASNYFNIKPYINEEQEIVLTRDNERIEPPEDFYMTDAIGENAIKFLTQRDRKRPFFLYLPFTAPHWPLQAPEEELSLHRGKYLEGWDVLRRERYERMFSMGIIGDEHELSGAYFRDPELTPDWDTLPESEKVKFDMRMAAYAATITRMDLRVGEVLNYLEAEKILNNTLILFLSDNGATDAYIYLATQWIADRSGPIGSEQSFEAQGGKWANVSNTPFRKFKKYTHEGGIITPLLLRYPGKYDAGSLYRQPGHIIDILPTVLDVTGLEYPSERNGKETLSLQGISLLKLTDTLTQPPGRILYWEHQNHEAIRNGNWKLVRARGEEWELHDLSDDPTELVDLSETYPGKSDQLLDLYAIWAAEMGVEDLNSLKLTRE